MNIKKINKFNELQVRWTQRLTPRHIVIKLPKDKEKIDKLGTLHENLKLCIKIYYRQSEKLTYGMRENTCKLYISDKRLIPRIYIKNS